MGMSEPRNPPMKRLSRGFWIVLALLFLAEAWLWDRLKPIVARVVGVIPWGRAKPALVALVSRLSPAATLVVFAIPFVLLLPLKFVEFWLLVHRQWIAAGIVLVLAKLIGLGITAFIFEVTKDKLLQMAWFRRVYDLFIWMRGWAHQKVDPLVMQMRERIHALTDPVARQLRRLKRIFGRRKSISFVERLMRVRRRMRGAAA
jgi:hypothetical protein